MQHSIQTGPLCPVSRKAPDAALFRFSLFLLFVSSRLNIGVTDSRACLC